MWRHIKSPDDDDVTMTIATCVNTK